MSPPPQRNSNPAKIFLLPNLMTAGNLIFGFLAVLKIFDVTSDTAPVQTLTDVDSVALTVSDHALVVEITP